MGYYPFGSQMPGRLYNSANYRYGFNGKENDNEVKGVGNEQDYGMRIYDGRLGKFLSVDPLFKDFAWNSPYSFAENDVIRSIDLDGQEKRIIVKVRDDAGKIIAMKITTNISNRNVVDQFIQQRNPDGSTQQIQDSNGNTYNNEGVVVIDYNSSGIPTVTFKKETELDKFETDVMNNKFKGTESEKNSVRTTKLNKTNGFKDADYVEEYRSGDKVLKISSTYESSLEVYGKTGGILKDAFYIDESSSMLNDPAPGTPKPPVNDVLDNIVKKEK
ncbi:MAG: RHS repeat domain-containing protein [Sphingobacteriaceae bacterium]